MKYQQHLPTLAAIANLSVNGAVLHPMLIAAAERDQLDLLGAVSHLMRALDVPVFDQFIEFKSTEGRSWASRPFSVLLGDDLSPEFAKSIKPGASTNQIKLSCAEILAMPLWSAHAPEKMIYLHECLDAMEIYDRRQQIKAANAHMTYVGALDHFLGSVLMRSRSVEVLSHCIDFVKKRNLFLSPHWLYGNNEGNFEKVPMEVLAFCAANPVLMNLLLDDAGAQTPKAWQNSEDSARFQSADIMIGVLGCHHPGVSSANVAMGGVRYAITNELRLEAAAGRSPDPLSMHSAISKIMDQTVQAHASALHADLVVRLIENVQDNSKPEEPLNPQHVLSFARIGLVNRGSFAARGDLGLAWIGEFKVKAEFSNDLACESVKALRQMDVGSVVDRCTNVQNEIQRSCEQIYKAAASNGLYEVMALLDDVASTFPKHPGDYGVTNKFQFSTIESAFLRDVIMRMLAKNDQGEPQIDAHRFEKTLEVLQAHGFSLARAEIDDTWDSPFKGKPTYLRKIAENAKDLLVAHVPHLMALISAGVDPHPKASSGHLQPLALIRKNNKPLGIALDYAIKSMENRNQALEALAQMDMQMGALRHK